jgi:hypothetical protein
MAGTPLQIVVGLGNPGPEHRLTRHNAGFWFVDALAYRHGVQFRAHARYQGEIAKVVVEGTELVLLKPQTYMNRSGLAIRALMDTSRHVGVWSCDDSTCRRRHGSSSAVVSAAPRGRITPGPISGVAAKVNIRVTVTRIDYVFTRARQRTISSTHRCRPRCSPSKRRWRKEPCTKMNKSCGSGRQSPTQEITIKSHHSPNVVNSLLHQGQASQSSRSANRPF